ncbi:MAG: polysaccharide deacetylase family protein [Treponema sp.]|nr:polysaccharide deacetylase family protein [Treponema sp.]
MKKPVITTVIICLLIAASLFTLGCGNAFSPVIRLLTNSADGNVKVSFNNGDGSRTLMPSLLDFDRYDFTFTKDGVEKSFCLNKAEMTGTVSFSLAKGDGYTLNVKAYSDDTLAAEGNSDPEIFSVDEDTLVKVILEGNLSEGGDGYFSFNIQYPQGASVSRLVLQTRGQDPIDVLKGTDVANSATGISGSISVPSGWWGLEIDLAMGDSVAYYDDIVVIYSDTVTFYGTVEAPAVFTSADFTTPEVTPPSGDTGTQVDNWHGFIIGGVGDVSKDGGNYLASNVPGTLYSSWKDGDGNSWEDVLELAPPADGYRQYSAALVYPIPDDGTYELSMEIWVDKDVDAQINWQEVNNWQYLNGGGGPITLQSGQWNTISGKFNNSLTTPDDIVLLAYGYSHFLDATIYIKNLVVQKADDTPVTPPSPPEDNGTQVDNWHGFIVGGLGVLNSGNYSASNAIGTQYGSWEDGNGNSWDDVLKLAPPAGVYPGNSVALIYEAEPGTYNISMDIWVNNGDSAEAYWQTLDSTNQWTDLNSGSVTLQPGQWNTISGNFKPLALPGELLLMARNWAGNITWLSATIYIKDLVVQKVDDTPVTPPSEDTGTQVDNWHGFIVGGVGDTYGGNYSASNVPGTQYSNWEDGDGNFWNDVLELEPPEVGYPQSSAALVYPIPDDGIYELSMEVWLDAGASAQINWQDVDHWQYLNGGGGPITLVPGEWNTISGKFNNSLTTPDDIVLLAYGYSCFLNATIYIKDLSVHKVNDTPVTPPSGGDTGKYIALTFDDVPIAESGTRSGTMGCLDALKNEGVKATFFVVGNGVSDNQDLIQRMYNEGHEICNHTFTHQSSYTYDGLITELQQTDTAIGAALGIPDYKTTYFRPPQGNLNLGDGTPVKNVAAALGKSIILWDYESYDYNLQWGVTSDDVYNNIINFAGNNICLCHGLDITAGVLSQAIEYLKAQGFQFVTVSEFLALKGLTLNAGDIYNPSPHLN